jgi:predicted phage terminase large subunit-like protein
VGIESNAYQVVLAEELMYNSRVPVRELHAHKDKVTRAMQLSAHIESGRVKFDRYRHQDLMRQLLDFPMGAHDDLVDALGYAVALAIEHGEYVESSEAMAAFDPYGSGF